MDFGGRSARKRFNACRRGRNAFAGTLRFEERTRTRRRSGTYLRRLRLVSLPFQHIRVCQSRNRRIHRVGGTCVVPERRILLLGRGDVILPQRGGCEAQTEVLRHRRTQVGHGARERTQQFPRQLEVAPREDRVVHALLRKALEPRIDRTLENLPHACINRLPHESGHLRLRDHRHALREFGHFRGGERRIPQAHAGGRERISPQTVRGTADAPVQAFCPHERHRMCPLRHHLAVHVDPRRLAVPRRRQMCLQARRHDRVACLEHIRAVARPLADFQGRHESVVLRRHSQTEPVVPPVAEPRDHAGDAAPADGLRLHVDGHGEGVHRQHGVLAARQFHFAAEERARRKGRAGKDFRSHVRSLHF